MENELEEIVQKMIDAGESEDNIANVIKNYSTVKAEEVNPKKPKAEVSGELASPSAKLDSSWGLPRTLSPMESSIKQEVEPTPTQRLEKMSDRGLSARDRASRELRKQYEIEGVKNYKITPEQVDQKAVQLVDEDRHKKIAKDIDNINKTKSTKEQRGYFSNLIDNVALSSTELGVIFAAIPESLYDIASIPQNVFSKLTGIDVTASSTKFKENTGISNPILDTYIEESKKVRENIAEFDKKYESTSVYENIKGGNYGDAFELLGSSIAQSSATSIAMMAGGASVSMGTLIAGSTVAMAGSKRLEIEKENPQLSELDKTIKGLGLAGAETVFGAIGEGTMGKVYKDILLKEGKETAGVVFKEGLIKMYDTALKKYGGAAGALGEGVEEVATTITQNMIQGKPAFEGVEESFIQGAGGGALYGAPINAMNVATKIKKGYDNRQIDKILESDTNNYTTISDAFKPEVGGAITTNKLKLVEQKGSLDKLNKELEKAVKGGELTQEESDAHVKEFLDTNLSLSKTKALDLTEENRTKAVDLIRKKEVLKAEVKDMDEALAVPKKEQIKKIDEELVGLATAKTKTITESTKEKSGEDVNVPATKEVVKTPATKEDVTEATPEDYANSMSTAIEGMSKTKNKINLQVDPVTTEDAKNIVEEGGKLFMTKDGKSGAYVKADGYMGGLFKDPSSNLSEVGKVLQQARVEAGGKYFDAYGTKLEDIYIKNGFVPVARVPFNEEFAPEGWDAKDSPLKDKPDVVFFAYDPNNKVTKGGGEVVTDYNTGLEAAKNYKPNEQIKTGPEATTTAGTTTNEAGANISPTGDVTASQEPATETRERAKVLADKIRNLKVNKDIKSAMSNLNSRPTALVEFAWDGAIETVAKTVELTGDLAYAIETGLSTLKSSRWYQGLSEKGQGMAERKYRDMFRDEIQEIESKKEKQGFFDSLNQATGQKFVDVFTNINRALKDLEGYRDLYKKEGLFESRAASEVDKMLNKVKDQLKVVSKSKYNVKQLSDFMYATHALERNAYIEENVDPENPYGSGMLDIQASKILEQYNDSETTELKALTKPFYDIIESTRQRMVDSGLMSQEAMDEMTSKNTTYVPLTGFADEQIELGQSVQSKKVNVKGREFKKMAGRTTEANNVVSNIVKQATDIAVRASKNEVLQEFEKIKKNNPEDSVPLTIHTQESLPTDKTVNKDGKVVYTKDKAQMDDNYIGFKTNGVQKYIKFENPVLAQNLNRATDSVVDSFTRYGGKLNRFLSASFTQYNPAFMIPNFFRDLQTALINLKAQADINPDLKGQDLSAKAIKGLRTAIATIHADERGSSKTGKVNDYYQEFKEEGAKTGWANKMSLKEVNAHVESISDMFALQEGSTTGKKAKTIIKKGWTAFSEVVDNANTSIENGIRLSTYTAARDSGLSKLDAASLAKELTINFNRKGEVGGLMNTLYLFFNASVQGTSTFKKNMLKFKTYEDSNGNIKKTLNRGQKVALAVQLASFALTLFNLGVSGDDEESGMSYYEGIPDYEKERNTIIMSPDGSGKYFKIPLPYGYNIFSNLGVMLAETTMGIRPIKNASSFLLGTVLGSFAPFASPEGSLGRKAAYATFPTVIAPVANLLENKDNFNNEIYRENFPIGEEKLSPAFLGSKNTPDVYKKTAIMMNTLGGGNKYQESPIGFHPDKAEFIVDYFGGGALKFLKDTYGVGEKSAQIAQGADLKIEPRRVPLVNKVYGEDTNFPERNIYYDVKENAQGRLNYLEKTPEGRAEQDPDKGTLRRLSEAYKESDKKLKELRGIEKEILLKEDSTEKLEKLEALEVKKNAVYSGLVKRYLRYKENLEGNYE